MKDEYGKYSYRWKIHMLGNQQILAFWYMKHIKIDLIKLSDRFDLLVALDDESKVSSSSLYNMSTQRSGLSLRLHVLPS